MPVRREASSYPSARHDGASPAPPALRRVASGGGGLLIAALVAATTSAVAGSLLIGAMVHRWLLVPVLLLDLALTAAVIAGIRRLHAPAATTPPLASRQRGR